MKLIVIIFLPILISACSSSVNEDNGPDTFALEKVGIALIYENNIEGTPCLLHNITDTLKQNKMVGIVFNFDVIYNNPTKGDGCCAFEPGVEGTKNKIDSIRIWFIGDSISFEVTDYLMNYEESQMKNYFENYIQDRFRPKDYICICKNDLEGFTEYVHRQHLDAPYNHDIDSSDVSIFENLNDFIEWYNYLGVEKGHLSGWKLNGDYYQFWLPNEISNQLKGMDKIQIKIKLDDGTILEAERMIKNELQQELKNIDQPT